ncbi:hypothetical protein GUA87_05650 [Sneathiella sp. P13V-1]|uniref:YdcF family protein n=1 Tax=Sneathiella sp. P13V-1 TaxID=2697366 RepID=UPI00187BB6F2|nr:ElyC/SanA/YdcF family protein [Sneathiella sp. P13V-1]MBE7636320.1 hypothetical protein [Sneathiella sp. P13V-1]
MFEYVTSTLSASLNVPSIMLLCVIAAGAYALVGANSRFFRILCTAFLVMSIPLIPKILFMPIDIGVLKVGNSAVQKAEVIVVITNGSSSDPDIGYQDLTNATGRRMAHAIKIAKELDLPMIASTTDKQEADIIASRYNKDVPVLVRIGGTRTRDHISQINDTLLKVEFSNVILITTGSHAFRTKTALEAKGFSVSQVIVGEKDGELNGIDLLPSFRGFLYWQIVLKEYWALGWYYFKGIL